MKRSAVILLTMAAALSGCAARTHSAEQVAQIAASILEFGFVAPVLIDERGEVIAGPGRLQAAKSLGLETVPVERAHRLDRAFGDPVAQLMELRAGHEVQARPVELQHVLRRAFIALGC